MTYPYNKLYGEAIVKVTSTAALAVAGSVAQYISVSLGRPVLDQIADIAVRFGIPRSAHVSDKERLLYKLTKGSDLSNSLTFAAQGVRSGDSLVLADTP